jgi:hypothetical protein
MILVERREMIENVLKEILLILDFEIYDELFEFMDADRHLKIITKNINIIMKFIRSILARKRLVNVRISSFLSFFCLLSYENLLFLLFQRLFRFYSQELLNFMYTMESGIDVFDMDENDPNEPFVLWLDICEEPALSRICLAPREIYSLPKEYEDERLANGIFLSDIAEVRKGAASHAFRATNHSFSSSPFVFRPDLCCAIVGSERTLSIQFIHPLLSSSSTFTINNLENNNKNNNNSNGSSSAIPPSLLAHLMPSPSAYDSPSLSPSSLLKNNSGKKTLNSGGGSASVPSSVVVVPSQPKKKIMTVDRTYFIDMLNLYSIQSLSTKELKNRNRRFVRCAPHSSVRVRPNDRLVLSKTIRTNAEKLLRLLVQGIEVDEETFSPHFGVKIFQKRLQYDPNTKKLFISSVLPSGNNDEHNKEHSVPAFPPLEALPVAVDQQNHKNDQNNRNQDDDHHQNNNNNNNSNNNNYHHSNSSGITATEQLQEIIEGENEDDSAYEGKESEDGHEAGGEDEEGEDEEEEGLEEHGNRKVLAEEIMERTSSSSHSSSGTNNRGGSSYYRDTMDSLGPNPPLLDPTTTNKNNNSNNSPPHITNPNPTTPLVLTPSKEVDLSHLRYDLILSQESRSMDIDDISEIRPVRT